MHNLRKAMKRKSKRQKVPSLRLLALSFGLIGVTTILFTLAAVQTISIEPETATISAPAESVADNNASNTKYIKFGAKTTPSAIKPLTPGTSWQWQLTGTIDTTVLDKSTSSKKMYDIDVFDVPQTTITTLKNKGIYVVCYFSAGSSENWRDDFNKFPASVQGKPLDSWPGEKWLDIRQINILGPIMAERMDLARSKGCDGVEPDNVDGYTNNTGFPLTGSQQIAYLKHLATLAHDRGLSIGLKNNVDQIADLVNYFDWALNEQCNQYNECGGYSRFIAQNKAVFGVEYSGSTSSFCPAMNAANYDWLLKNLNLNVARTPCRNG